MEIKKEELLNTLTNLKATGYNMLLHITAIDNIDHLTILYVLYNTSTASKEIVSIDLHDSFSIDSASQLYKSAAWYERELAEMFGVSINNSKRKRLLLEEWNGVDFPLRKSFKWGAPYNKVMQ